MTYQEMFDNDEIFDEAPFGENVTKIGLMLEKGETSNDDFTDMIDSVIMNQGTELDELIELRDTYLATVSNLKTKKAEILSEEKQAQMFLDSLEEKIYNSMISTGQTTSKGKIHSVAIGKARKQLPKNLTVDDVPVEYVAVKKEIKKSELLKAIKEKKVKGIELVDGKRSLTIK